MDFNAIASRMTGEPCERIERRSCPDQYVGSIADIRAIQEFPLRHPVSERPPDQRCLVLVLESPHIHEFAGEPAPANGRTGTNISKMLPEDPQVSTLVGYGLVLINAIQYQCSLGHQPARFRNKVFVATWNAGGKESFKARIASLYRTGDQVMNCCTKGTTKARCPQLRMLVHAAIGEALPHVNILRRTHPSSWCSPTQARRVWEQLPNMDNHSKQKLPIE